MIDNHMAEIIRNHSAGMVATVNGDGTPAVSPKGTFVVIDQFQIAFGNIRSPGTIANLKLNPKVEVCFLDPLCRTAVRVGGIARIHPANRTPEEVLRALSESWPEYVPLMKETVVISAHRAEVVRSPAYDLGYTEHQLKQARIKAFGDLASDP